MTEEEDARAMAGVERIEECGRTSGKKDRLGWQSRRERTVEQTGAQRAGSRNRQGAEGQ